MDSNDNGPKDSDFLAVLEPGFLRALRLAGDELYVFDREGTILEVNDHACTELGYGRDELVGSTLFDISTRQTPESYRSLLRILDEDGPQFLHGHSRRKDGSTYSVEARLWTAPYSGESATWALLRDARGHQSLMEERDRLISLIENSSEAIAVASPEGQYRYMNAAGLKMIGLESVQELAGKSIVDFHPEVEHRDLEERILPLAREDRWEGELFYRNPKSGERIPCWMKVFSVRHSRTGRTAGLAVIARDISAHKVAERQRDRLLLLNEVSRKVATSLLQDDDLNKAIGIILEGVGNIISVGRSFLCRYREERRLVFRTHEWTRDWKGVRKVSRQPESHVDYAWATDILVRGDYIRISDLEQVDFMPPDSTMFRHDVRAALVMPVIIHGRLESFFGFVDTQSPREWEDEEVALLQIIVDSFARAIERRIAERERERISRDLEDSAAREKAANRYKSEFLANMSHELRTPMNAIVGYAELLGRPNVDGDKQRVWVENIRKSTDYLLSLINDVLDLSKIEAGQMTIERERCELAALVTSVEDLLRGWSQEKLLDFRLEYTGPVPSEVETDPVRFKQILINLIGNAIKFTHEGSVVVRIGTEAADEGDASELVVSVIDTGIGIAPDALEDLFRPFAQVHNRRNSRFAGTGLGLDISRHLARLLGGKIAVNSEVGVGSTFTFRMALSTTLEAPMAVPEVKESAAELPDEKAIPSLRGAKLLVVDDSLENRDVLRFLLEESGCQPECAENGALGVKAALQAQGEGQPFDAILMDMSMPVMDGYEAAAELVRGGSKAPIIALTALAMADDKARCLEAGCVDYVTKPIVPHVFFETLRKHIEIDAAPVDVQKSEPQAETLELLSSPRFAPLIRRYVASFPGLVTRLREALGEGRLEEVRIQVHRLRGTATNYGFPELSDLAGRSEDAIREERPRSEIEGALQALVQELEVVSKREQA